MIQRPTPIIPDWDPLAAPLLATRPNLTDLGIHATSNDRLIFCVRYETFTPFGGLKKPHGLVNQVKL
jgi:hypothetical protein